MLLPYAIILALATFSVLFRQDILLKGSTWFKFNAIYIIVGFPVFYYFYDGLNVYHLAIMTFILIFSWFSYNLLLIFHSSRATVRAKIETSLRGLLLPVNPSPGGYDFPIGDTSESVHINFLPFKITVLSFTHKSGQKKVKLLAKLLTKQFDSIFPRITIKLK